MNVINLPSFATVLGLAVLSVRDPGCACILSSNTGIIPRNDLPFVPDGVDLGLTPRSAPCVCVRLSHSFSPKTDAIGWRDQIIVFADFQGNPGAY